MGMFDFLKKKKPEEPKSNLPVMQDITLGRTAVVDTLALDILGPDHRLKLSSSSLTITGQGCIKFEDGMWLHRFYTDDHMLLQIMGGDGRTSHDIEQISLFSVWDSIEPTDQATTQAELKKMRQTTYTLDGKTYDRVWFDGDGEAELVQFHETVNLSEDESESYGIQQSCMLFARDVDGHEESLLVTHEKTDQGSETISYMVGAILSPNDISI